MQVVLVGAPPLGAATTEHPLLFGKPTVTMIEHVAFPFCWPFNMAIALHLFPYAPFVGG